MADPAPLPGSSRLRLGALGEQLAVRHLEQRGLTVLMRNWRPRTHELRGEIDVVACDTAVTPAALVFCEVKTRRGDVGAAPLESVTRLKQARLRRLASAFLREQAAGWSGPLRFDVVGVRWPAGGGPPEVVHLPGAF